MRNPSPCEQAGRQATHTTHPGSGLLSSSKQHVDKCHLGRKNASGGSRILLQDVPLKLPCISAMCGDQFQAEPDWLYAVTPPDTFSVPCLGRTSILMPLNQEVGDLTAFESTYV